MKEKSIGAFFMTFFRAKLLVSFRDTMGFI
jgi:hypothetical protein